MTQTNDFIAELVRAANEVEKLSDFERRRLLERTVTTVKDMRDAIGIPHRRSPTDKIIDLQVMAVAIGAEAKTSDEVRQALLTAAGMIRDLHIVLDTGTAVHTSEP